MRGDPGLYSLFLYTVGDIPWFHAYLVPGLIKDLRGANNAANYGLIDIYQEAFYSKGLNIKVVRMFSPGCTTLITKKQILVPEELKGMKLANESFSQAIIRISNGRKGLPMQYLGMIKDFDVEKIKKFRSELDAEAKIRDKKIREAFKCSC